MRAEIKLYNEDCLDTMARMPDDYIDFIQADPPYNLEIDNDKYSGVYAKKGAHLDKIKENFGNRFDPIMFLDEAMRVSKNGAIIWHSKSLLPVYINYAGSKGYKWNLEFWHKRNPIPAHFNHKLNDTEFAIRIYESGAYFNNNLDYKNYFTYYIEDIQRNNGYPTPKPLSIISEQLLVYTKEGDLIYDPFMGSGTTAIACLRGKRSFIGSEISKEYFKIAQKRIKNEENQFNLFNMDIS